ncbi:MAG TPA: DUF1236 domain-containing protein [Xanthobacteraceae bacterium]|nr:DUF1236 domain-containing protein [Xanthobacteraceae bacterium]
MRRELIGAVTTFALVAGSQAFAQSALDISADQRAKIKEYITQQKVQPAATKERLAVGATVPAGVALMPAPATWGPAFLKYQFVYADNRVLLVEPRNRKVVQVIE